MVAARATARRVRAASAAPTSRLRRARSSLRPGRSPRPDTSGSWSCASLVSKRSSVGRGSSSRRNSPSTSRVARWRI